MDDDTAYSSDEPDNKYCNVLSERDFCEVVDNIGVVFSLTVRGEQVVDGSLLANVTIRQNENATDITTDAEGKITPATHSITGTEIPRRLFLAIPPNIGISTELLRSAKIEVNSIKPMNGKSIFDDFRVSY